MSNDQRKVIYQQRNDILDANDLSGQIASLRDGCFTDLTHAFVPPESVEEQWDLAGLEKVLAEDWQINVPLRETVQAASAITGDEIVEKVLEAARLAFTAKVDLIGGETLDAAFAAVRPGGTVVSVAAMPEPMRRELRELGLL